jgi:hypothetical protein
MQFLNDILYNIQMFFSDTTNIFLSLVLLISLFAAFATIAAYNSSKQAKKALRAGMMNDLLDSRYTEKNIVARKNLINYYDTCRKHGYDYVKTFLANRNSRKVEKEIDKSRQVIFSFFDKVYRLRQSGLLKSNDLKRLIDDNELELFINRCWPLCAGVIDSTPGNVAHAKSGDSQKHVYNFYHQMYKIRF